MPVSHESLRKAALHWAKANGDADPAEIRTVRAPARDVLAFLGRDLHYESNPAADEIETDLVMVRGRFVAHMAHPPKGARLPTGTNLWFILESDSGDSIGWGLNNADDDLSALGPVHDLLHG